MTAPIGKKSALLMGSAVVAATMIAPPAFSNGLDDDGLGKPATVQVNCGQDTIGKALNKHPSRPLVIFVKGTCAEDVRIERDRVTLAAATPHIDGIVGQADAGNAVTVAGAQNIIIDGLRVRAANQDSTAVLVTGNGEATIHNALVEDSGFGIWASHGGFFLLRNSEVLNGRFYGLLLTDAGNARVESSVVEIHNSETFSSAAIGGFRSVNIRLRGNNQIRNGGDNKIFGDDDDGFSLDLFHSAALRQDGGHTVFIGSMEFGNQSHASLRDPEITGGLQLFSASNADVRKSSTGSNEILRGRETVVANNSKLDLRAGITAELGAVSVFSDSTLSIEQGVDATAEGGTNVGNAFLGLESFAALSTPWFSAFENAILNLGDNATLDVSEHMNLGRSTVNFGPLSKITVGGQLGAFDTTRIGVWGPHASLEVAGDLFGGSFFNLNVGDHSSLQVDGQLNLNDFSLMFASSHATITADLTFGGSATKVNFAGNDVTYNGEMNFFDKGDMTFGFNNFVNGIINCNGNAFAGPTPIVLSGTGIINCL